MDIKLKRSGTMLALLAAGVLALSACQTGGTQPPEEEGFGALGVVVAGLPAGAAADVTITGPSGFSAEVTTTETFGGLAPGSYTVTAANVTAEGVQYAGTPTPATVNVLEDDVAISTVTYSAVSTEPGTLELTVDGLPGGVDGDVNVTGPGGFDDDATASTTFDDVEPGVYSVTAQQVTDGADVYAPTVSGSPATVPAGGTATVTVTYTFLDPALTGTLQVDVSGLPGGVLADVDVSGPGFAETVTESSTLAGLTPAFYEIVANDVVDGGLTYTASVDVPSALVIPDETTTVTVTYLPVAPNDGDSASVPGLSARFRSTAGAPVAVDELLFNDPADLDVKGLQLSERIGDPADPGDFILFELVHGESPTTTVEFTLECSEPNVPSPVKVEVRDDDGKKLGSTVVCGQTRSIAIPAEGGTPDYLVSILPNFSDPYYTEYVLSIDAFCFQACAYQPFEP